MPYYSAMGDYYQGDNYAAGGLFGSIGKFLGGAARTALSLTPVGRVAQAVAPRIFGGAPMIAATASGTNLIPTFNRPGPGPMIVPTPGFSGFAQRALPGGKSGYELAFRKRRRINPLNIKALRRAVRRAKSFERQARRVGTFFNPGKSYRLKGRARKRAS